MQYIKFISNDAQCETKLFASFSLNYLSMEANKRFFI